MNIEIAGRAFKHAEESFQPGDKIVVKTYLDNGTLDERQVQMMRRQNAIVPLTREAYALAMLRRGPGEIGRGFTVSELVKLEIIAQPAAEPEIPPEPPKAPAKPKPKPKPHRPTQEPAAIVPRTAETVEYKGSFLTPLARAKSPLPPIWWVTSSDGQPKRNTGFAKFEGAQKFVDGLAAKPAADTSGDAPEGPAAETEEDDSDIRSSADDSQG